MIQLNSATPVAHITSNRNRLKSYGNAVYLKSGSNFEIEIFNTLTSRTLVTIEVDGKLISSTGLVVNPGQREYLERWIDEPRKFKFSTYTVENSPEAMKAIANNGKVKVSFFEESTKLFTNNGTYYTNDSWNFGDAVYYSNSLSSSSDVRHKGVTRSFSGGSIETGRTEKGETSNQNFDSTTGDFNSWATAIIEIQILPESAKPIEIEKIRMYCTGCGTRVRAASWKFCPSCGEKV